MLCRAGRPWVAMGSSTSRSLLLGAALLAVVGCGSEAAEGETTLPDVQVTADAGGDILLDDTASPDLDASPGDELVEPDVAPPPPDVTTPDADPPDAILEPEDVTPGPPDVAPDITPEPPIGDAPSPMADGPATVEVLEVEVPNASGDAQDALLFVPAGTERHVTVIFHHGLQLTNENFRSYGQRLASHGMIVLMPNTGDTLTRARTHALLAQDTVEALNWLEDQDEFPASPIFTRVDRDAIGVAGHSRGGKQAIFAATTDARIGASFTLDPVDSGPPFGSNPTDYPSVAPERMADHTIPGGFVGAGLAGTGPFPFAPACAPPDDNYAQYFSAAAGPSFQYAFADAGHLDFLDSCSGLTCRTCTAGSDPAALRDASRGLMTAFFLTFLAQDTRYRAWVDGSQARAIPGMTLSARE